MTEPTPCAACESSKADPTNDRFWTAGCEGCMARALAATGAHLESNQKAMITSAYRKALEMLFGAERWQAGHELTKHWAALIDGGRSQHGKSKLTEQGR